jgi:hypothetical protein
MHQVLLCRIQVNGFAAHAFNIHGAPCNKMLYFAFYLRWAVFFIGAYMLASPSRLISFALHSGQ